MLEHVTQSRDYINPPILFNDKLPFHRFYQIFNTSVLRHLDLTSLLNARPFKCVDHLADQIIAEVVVLSCFEDAQFRELVVLKNLLVYFELQESS